MNLTICMGVTKRKIVTGEGRYKIPRTFEKSDEKIYIPPPAPHLGNSGVDQLTLAPQPPYENLSKLSKGSSAKTSEIRCNMSIFLQKRPPSVLHPQHSTYIYHRKYSRAIIWNVLPVSYLITTLLIPNTLHPTS